MIQDKCENCGKPLEFPFDKYEVKYFQSKGLPMLCLDCTHRRLGMNERDRVELSV